MSLLQTNLIVCTGGLNCYVPPSLFKIYRRGSSLRDLEVGGSFLCFIAFKSRAFIENEK